MRLLRSLRLVTLTAVTSLAISVLAGASTAAPTPAAERGEDPLRAGFRILQSRSFEAGDGHLYTTADLEVDGRVIRGVTAPGGRIGERWESVAALPAIGHEPGGPSADHRGSAGQSDGPWGADAFRLQVGEAAGSTASGAGAGTGAYSAASSSFSTLFGYGWCSRSLDAPYRINTARAPRGAVDAVRAGFNVWTHHPDSWMSFVYKGGTTIAKSSRDDGVNAVFFTHTPESILGRTWTYGTGRFVNGFDMQLNTKYALSVGGSGYDVQSLAAHEAGHAAGLGHTSTSGNLMYGGGQAPRQIVRSLGGQDRAGLVHLYPYGDLRGVLVSATAPSTLSPGARGTMTATFENRGRTPWGGRFPALRVRTSSGNASAFADSTWVSASQPIRNTTALCQGGRITVSWPMRAPSLLQTFTPSFVPVVGPTTKARWLTGATVQRTIRVAGSSDGGGGDDDDDGRFCFIICW